MEKFNLTFNGEILPGQDLAEVKVRFAKALSIEIPTHVDAFFSGKTVIIRRNLDKSTAEAFYTKLYRAGVVLKLKPIQKKSITRPAKAGKNRRVYKNSLGNAEQNWPIRSTSPKKSSPELNQGKRGNAVLQAEEQQRREAEAITTALEEKYRIATEAAEKKAAKKAEQKTARKKAVEEAAREKVKEKTARKEATEKAAREKAKEKSARKKAAEEAAHEKAQKETARKKAAEEAAREKAKEETAIGEALKLASRKAAEKKTAGLRTELAKQKRIHAEEAARGKAEEKRIEDELRTLTATLQATEQSQDVASDQKQRVQSQQEKQAAADQTRVGSERPERLKRIPRRSTIKPTVSPTRNSSEKQFRRQPGAPNFFSLKPFRSTVEIRQRAEKAQKLMKMLFITSVLTLLALLILGTRYTLLPAASPVASGGDAILTDTQSGLIVKAGTKLFSLDRSGVATGNYTLSELGLDTPINLLGVDASHRLIIQERHDTAISTNPEITNTGDDQWHTLRCSTSARECHAYAEEIVKGRISSYVINSRTGESFATAPDQGLLLKLTDDGVLLNQTEANIQEHANLALHEGLLYMSSATGAAISIYRPDSKGFGTQLDEVLLLPPTAQGKEQTQVGEFLWSENSWWVAMTNPETLEAGVYRFDAKWNYVSTVPLTDGSHPEHLLKWASKVLVLDSSQLAIQRFNSEGMAETSLIPIALQNYIESEQNKVARTQRLWHLGLGFLALVGMGSYMFGRLYQLRSLVYKKDKVSGAVPIDNKEKLIRWIDPSNRRASSFRFVTAVYSILCLSALALIFFLTLPVTVMLGAVVLFTGPAIALALLWTSSSGYIGTLEEQLILVDQHNTYHMAGGARIHYRNHFLLIDDIIVFIGTPLLPVFSTTQLRENIVPMARTGIKVDRKTVIVRLIQSSHPIAKGLYVCTACIATSICLLLF